MKNWDFKYYVDKIKRFPVLNDKNQIELVYVIHANLKNIGPSDSTMNDFKNVMENFLNERFIHGNEKYDVYNL